MCVSFRQQVAVPTISSACEPRAVAVDLGMTRFFRMWGLMVWELQSAAGMG
jgi:hypothetical protein